MKNQLHADAARFWQCRAVVLSERASRPAKWLAQRRMDRITRRWHAVIPNTARIAGVPVTPHGLIGIFISKQAVIGKNVTIHQNVTIGSVQTPGSKHPGAPVIGDDVVVGANAVVVGGITIGNRVQIGAGIAVATDVPDDATVVSANVRIIERKTQT